MLGGLIFLLSGLLILVNTVSPQHEMLAGTYDGGFIDQGLYLGIFSVGLIIGGSVLCFQNRAKLGKLRPLFNGKLRFLSVLQQVATNLLANKAAIVFLGFGLYALITPYLGYAMTTFLFFFGIFGWQGYKWSLRNLVLSLITTMAFVAFARIASIQLPMGFVKLW